MVDIIARIRAIYNKVKILRTHHYPPGYDMDSWYKIQRELEALLIELGRGPASAP